MEQLQVVNDKLNRTSKAKSQSVSEANMLQDDVAKEAYYLYLNEGCPQGRADQHWFQAESKLHHHGADYSIHHSNHHSQHHAGHHF